MSNIVLARRWSPAQEGRCLYWQDTYVQRGLCTDTGLTTPVVNSGDQVASILDLSGNVANAAQPSSTRRGTYTPTAVNSRPAVTLDGSDDYYPVTLPSVPSNGTIFVAWKPITLASFSSPCSIRATPTGTAVGGLICYYNVVSGRVTMAASDASAWSRTFTAGSPTPNGTACIWVWSWGNTLASLDFRCNRTASTTFSSAGTYATPTASNIYLGAGYSSTKGAMALAEVIVFGEQLATSKILRIESYLKAKWGTA